MLAWETVAAMSAAAWTPASMSRTAMTTSARAAHKARAVSMPMPEDAPVTIARRPCRPTPRKTSAAVDSEPKGVRR